MKKILLLLAILLISSINLFSNQFWKLQKSIPIQLNHHHWLDIYFLPSNPQYGWVCGMNGTIMWTTDQGNQWTPVLQKLKTDHLERIKFLDDKFGFCSGPANQLSQPGVYTSTNGGRNWVDITPIDLITRWQKNSESSWYVDFRDMWNGILGAGECISDSLIFYKTTDGGATWSSVMYRSPDTRLCDIKYIDDNLCYALAGDSLWKTTNGGVSWNTVSSTGDARHQEELSISGSTFLIPYSGITCQGTNENFGGIKVSTDNGLTWLTKDFGTNMFGVFLTSSTKGWAVGDQETVYYTSDAGKNWEILDCGIKATDLDDIFFASDGTGWTCGLPGIYKLSPLERNISEDGVSFKSTCIGETAYDTVWVVNRSFDKANVTKQLLTPDESDIDIIYPTTSQFIIQACDSIGLILEYHPQKKSVQTERWAIQFTNPPIQNYELEIIGEPSYSSAQAVFKESTDTAYCNSFKKTNFEWSVLTNQEYIYQIVKNRGVSWINYVGTLPFPLKSSISNYTPFALAPIDTGWSWAEFEALTRPCDAIHKFKVNCYGISSIITTIEKKTVTAACREIVNDTITVANTGNFNLIISKVEINQPANDIEILGWSGEGATTTTIAPGKSKRIALRYNVGRDGLYPAQIVFHNNDSTKIRGDKNPYIIKYTANRNKTNLSANNSEINFGKICHGETVSKIFTVSNSGILSAELLQPKVDKSIYNFELFNSSTFPFSLRTDTSVNIKLSFTPNKEGIISDTLYIRSNPCGDAVKIIVKAVVQRPIIEHIPAKIIGITQAGFEYSTQLTLKNIGEIDLSIFEIELYPNNPDIDVTITPTLPLTLNSGTGNGTEATFDLTFLPQKEVIINSCIRVKGMGICQLDTCIPIHLQVIDRYVYPLIDTLDFGYIKCNSQKYSMQIPLYNAAMQKDTVVSVSLSQSGNAFKNLTPLPLYIASKDTGNIIIEFDAQKEGKFSGDVIISTIEPNGQIITIPIKAEFQKAETSIDRIKFNQGMIDTCIGIVSYGFTFQNDGTLPDTINISELDNSYPVNTIPTDRIIIPANGNNSMTVYVNYSKFNTLGQKSIIINAVSQTCPKKFELLIEADLRKPILEISPDTVSFNAWMNYSDTKTVLLKNESGLDLDIENIKIIPDDGSFSYSLAPMQLKNGQNTSFNITYKAKKEGNYLDTMIITTKDKCIELNKLYLKYSTPDEIYNIGLKLTRHESVKMGDTVLVTLSLNKKVDFLVSDTVNFKFSYYWENIYPQNVYVKEKNGVFKEMNFKEKPGVLYGQLIGENAQNIYNEPGSILKINFLTLRSYPDTTTIFIDDFSPAKTKDIIWEKENGFIRLTDYCIDDAINNIRYLAQYSINDQRVQNDDLLLNISVTQDELEIGIKFVNIIGQIVAEKDFYAVKGENSVRVDLSDIPSGFYILEINSNFNQRTIGKTVIIK